MAFFQTGYSKEYGEKILAAKMKGREKRMELNAKWREEHPDWPNRPTDEQLKALQKALKGKD